jgi:hypothetical protein
MVRKHPRCHFKRALVQHIQTNPRTSRVRTVQGAFCQDLKRIDVPTLITYGDVDGILRITASGLRTVKLIKGATETAQVQMPQAPIPNVLDLGRTAERGGWQ